MHYTCFYSKAHLNSYSCTWILLVHNRGFLWSVPKVERVTKTMTEDKKEYDLKMQEYAQLLDIRADRIRVSIAIKLKLH